jgi:ATP-dependent Clp protease ATP-binding subunit ClpA
MTNPVVLTDAQIIHDFGQEIARLRHELANARTHITLQASIHHLLEQHIASQDTVIRAAREVVRCSSAGCRDARGPSATFHLANALRILDHASS